MGQLKRQLMHGAAAVFALAAMLGVARVSEAAGGSGDQPCFFLRAWDGQWKVSPDAKSIYVRENGTIWRWDLRQPVDLLKSTWAVLNTGGTNDAVCRGTDLHLIVSDRLGAQIIAIVNTITQLSPEEAAQLPKELHPGKSG
jgi:hypothetical protein